MEAGLSKPIFQLSVDGRGLVPPSCLTLDQTMVRVMKIMMTSFKRSCASSVLFSSPDPLADLCCPTSLLKTPGHSQSSLYQSLVMSLFFSPGSWCTQGFVCALQESISPVLCKFCNQIRLASKVKFPGGSQSLCQIPRLGNLLCILELS